GELASRSSKSCREITEAEFGKMAQGLYGRKVDLAIRVLVEGAWTGEIAVFECKPVVSDSICIRQLKKSIRLNAAILLDLERQGLNITHWFPVIAENRGLVLDHYTMKRYDDILGLADLPLDVFDCHLTPHNSKHSSDRTRYMCCLDSG
ncbi:hypothetical protein BGW38_008805, partial [Lunasporangiospora selenospora]